LSALLGLANGTAIGGCFLPQGYAGDGLRSIRWGVMVGGMPGATIGLLIGLHNYRRKRPAKEVLDRHIVSLLTALAGLVLGTMLVSPLVLSIDRYCRFLGGMVFGGILLSFCGYHWGRDHFRHAGVTEKEGQPTARS